MPTIDELKYLSQRRMEAVKILTENEVFDIAYQDSGYILEFGLKAAICKQNELSIYPERTKETQHYFTHHLDSLVRLAGLEEELAEKKSSDRDFMKNWSLTTKWSVHLRYQPIGENVETITTSFVNAISSEKGGVLPWIKTHW